MSGKHAEVPEPADIPERTPSVEQQRADVTDTVAALAAKADVPARVANEASFQAERAKTVAAKNPQLIAAAIGAVVTGTIVTIVVRTRRSRRLFR